MPMMISVKNLAEVALPDFCERCFWVKLKSGFRLPYQIFPGIFNSIDAYTKKIVQGYFDKEQELPRWLCDVGEVVGYIQPPHYSKFSYHDAATDITVRGTPDAIYVCADATHVIGDFKTSRYTSTAESLFPLYVAQLNGYALIGEHQGLLPSKLALIYMEPLTDEAAAAQEMYENIDGFALRFAARLVDVPLHTSIIHPLLATTRKLYERSFPPERRADCKNCTLVSELGLLALMT